MKVLTEVEDLKEQHDGVIFLLDMKMKGNFCLCPKLFCQKTFGSKVKVKIAAKESDMFKSIYILFS